MRVRVVAANCLLAALAGGGLITATPAHADGDVTVTVQVSEHRQVGDDLTVSGDVTSASGSIVYPVMVTLQRDHSPEATTQATDATGHYVFTDTPDTRGSVTYTVSWPGDAGHPSGATNSAVVQVAGKPTSLSLSTDRSVVTTGHTVHLTAHLGSTTTNRNLTIYATPYHQSRLVVTSGSVDSSGDLTAAFSTTRRTTFSAHFSGDDAYAPATVRRLVRARGEVDERLTGGYGRSGAYRLYHEGTNPSLHAQLFPEHKGWCLYFRAQHHYSGSWHTSAVSSCVRTDSSGRVIGVLQRHHVVGEPYRVRAEWRGNSAVLARAGAWLKLEFRR